MLVLILGTFLVYSRVFTLGFVDFDDTDFVTANPHVQAGLTWDSFKWVWHSNVARNWHPITMLTHMLDCQLYGLHAGGHHLTNLLIHIANAVLLFYVLKMMTGAVWRSAFVAALFAWHPLHVESVAWIAERKDVLSTFFWFLTIYAYVRYARELGKEKSRIYYALTLMFLALGLMSKPMLVTAPFALLLLDLWPLGRMSVAEKPAKKKTPPSQQRFKFPARLVWEKIPMLLMSVTLCVITYSIQKHGGAVHTLSLGARFDNALVAYVRYIGKMVWPSNLAGLYLRSGPWPAWVVISSASALVVVSIIAIMQLRRRPWLAVGWFWYLGTLVPVIGLVQVGMQTMADRFTYVPLIGIFIIVAWGVAEWYWPDFALKTVAVAVLAVCLGLTYNQTQYWRNSEALFDRMIAVTDNNYMAHYNLGNMYLRQKRLEDAIAQYKAAIEEEPNYADAHNNYGNILLTEKDYDAAIDQFNDAIRINATSLYYLNLANGLADAASARHDTNEFAAAVTAYNQAISMNPTSAETHHNLGLTWDAQGREEDAANEYRAAIQIDPSFEPAHFDLASTLFRLGKLDDAIVEYRIAAGLNPNRAENFSGLGVCCAMQNKMADAADAFKQLVRLEPDNAGAFGNLGNALAAQNRIDEAIPYYEAALRLDPRNYQSEFNLGLALAHQGKNAEAETHYGRALSLNPNYRAAQEALRQLEERK
jgi:tetratricopeptide (TPR) repeat protein